MRFYFFAGLFVVTCGFTSSVVWAENKIFKSASNASALNPIHTASAPTTISTPASTTISTPASTTISTPAPTTISTSDPTTISTPAPTTISTPAPTTISTPAPTTISTPAPTTISTPADTTWPSTSTTPSSTTVAPPKTGQWNVADEDGVYCILTEMAIQISASYQTGDNETSSTTLDVPKSANSSGSCDVPKLNLTWENNELAFFFRNDSNQGSERQFYISKIYLSLDLHAKMQDELNFTSDEDLFNTAVGYSYFCAAEQKVNLTANGTESFAVLKLSNVRLEAFHDKKDKTFSTEINCEGSKTSDAVPIIVGSVLAALVVIVLVAYLIGRRRSRSGAGYQSM